MVFKLFSWGAPREEMPSNGCSVLGTLQGGARDRRDRQRQPGSSDTPLTSTTLPTDFWSQSTDVSNHHHGTKHDGSRPKFEQNVSTDREGGGHDSYLPPSVGAIATREAPGVAQLFNDASPTPNVLIFGKTGVGKSSLINMLADCADIDIPDLQEQTSTQPLAPVSNTAKGCTFRSNPYHVRVDGQAMTLWDTAGLDEGEHGSVPAERAMQNLLDLVKNLTSPRHTDKADYNAVGLSVLVYCIRGTRFTDITKINYDMFYHIICRAKVPIVAVITGLEHTSPMEFWWDENGHEFENRGMRFAGHACVTTTRGKKISVSRLRHSPTSHEKDGPPMVSYSLDDEYAESRRIVRALIKKHCASRPWIAEKHMWLKDIAFEIRNYYDQGDFGAGIIHQNSRQDVEAKAQAHRGNTGTSGFLTTFFLGLSTLLFKGLL